MGDVVRIILSVLIPPLGVFFKVGFGMHFWINIVLTILGYVPGLVHAVWVVATKKQLRRRSIKKGEKADLLSRPFYNSILQSNFELI